MPAVAPRSEPEPTEEPTPESETTETEATDAAPEVEDWRPTYEHHLAEWRAEADIARERAAATRAKYEAEAAAKAKEEAEAKKAASKKSDAEEKERKEKLAAALAEPPAPATVPAHKRAAVEQRAAKIREAWELVKDKKEAPSAPSSQGQWEEVSAPHSSVEDISASPLSSASDEKREKEEKVEKKEVHGKDLTVPAGITPVEAPAASSSAAPAPADATPSLTLSLFTAPKSLTLPRVIAALGINLILPFINGVFLGFGEITAREAVRVGRLWWKGERAIAGFWRRDDGSVVNGGGARAVSAVGLSGGAGF